MNTTGSGAKKPYYLWEVLQFLMPYTKSRPQSGNLPATVTQRPQNMRPEPQNIEEDDIIDTPIIPPEDLQLSLPATVANTVSENNAASSTQPLSIKPSGSLSAWRSTKAKERKVDPLEKSLAFYFNKKGSEVQPHENNPDLYFFKSILPDIANFTPAKKRQFKRKVMDIIDELSEDSPQAPST